MAAKHTCMGDDCENDTGSAERLKCSSCEPPEKLTPVERKWRANERRAARRAEEREPFSASEFWQNVRESRSDTGERGPVEA